MCKVYNSVGCLKTIKSHLHQHGVDDLNSLNEVIAFQKNYPTNRKQILSTHENLIEQEKDSLRIEISELKEFIESERLRLEIIFRSEIDGLKRKLNNLSTSCQANLFQKSIRYLRKRFYRRKILQKELGFDSSISYSLQELNEIQTEKNNRYNYITSHYYDAIKSSSLNPINDLDKKKAIIDEVNTSILGALGEQKVVAELENLSDEYFLINDFSLSFPTPIFNRQENEYIKSIQIDHILVGPSGIFLIETKNWSNESLKNLSLRSPVQQVKRTSYALFKILNQEIADYSLKLSRHHWGNRKVPIRNLIVMINSKPNGEFQFVKIITINKLLGYIAYFKPAFSNDETQEIANSLLGLKNKK